MADKARALAEQVKKALDSDTTDKAQVEELKRQVEELAARNQANAFLTAAAQSLGTAAANFGITDNNDVNFKNAITALERFPT